MRFDSLGKDHYGAIICVLMGAAVLGLAFKYQLGTLQNMGAGFVPAAIGAMFILVGLAIGFTATPRSKELVALEARRREPGERLAGRAWICIIGGVVAFVVLGTYGGLLPASFFSIFIAALGDRDNTVRGSAALAAVVTAFGILIFYYFLSLQMPLLQWGG